MVDSLLEGVRVHPVKQWNDDLTLNLVLQNQLVERGVGRTVNSDDELDIDVERPFVIYAIETVAGKRAWVPEEILEAALE